MVKLCSYYKMCVSIICPANWLRLATSFQLRGSGVKLGFERAQSFSICRRNNSDNNFGQYQWKLRSLSCRTSTVHAIRAAEVPPLLSSVVRYQIRKYSVVRKGQIQDSLEASFHLEEPLENPSKLRTKSKDLLQNSSLLEEHLGKSTKPKKSKRKLDVINSNEDSLEPLFSLGEPLKEQSTLIRTRSKVGQTVPNKEPIQKVTKSKKTRRKLDVTDSNEVFYRMEFDGASKGNPGKAGAGAVLRNQDGSVICELKEGVGTATNNVAEYRAIILGLKVALSRGIQRIHVQGDSKLVCMQIQDLWKIKCQNIAELSKEAKELKSKFKEFRIHHIYRELNGEADALANAAVGLKNGEIKNGMATYRLDNPLEKTSSSQRERSKVDLVNPKKKLSEASLPLEKCLEKPLKSGRTIRSGDRLDVNKNSLDTASPSVECLTNKSKPKKMTRKVGLTDPNKELLQVSSILEEPIGKGSKSKETKRKLKVTDSNEGPLQKPSNSKRKRNTFCTDPAEVFYWMEFDGASKGNPGKAGAGVVLRNQDGSVICELKEGVGTATNNVAEYRAVILGLKVALSRGIQRIHVQGDSMLVCMQIQDLWKIKSQNIAELSKEAKELKSKFKEIRIHHIYREWNSEADALANAAIELKNGEIRNGMATYRLDNPLEKMSSSQREISKVDVVNRKKKLSQASLPLEKLHEKPLKSGRTSSSDDLRDTNKVSLDTASPSVESLTNKSKPRKMRSKVGLTDPNKEMLQASSLSEEPVGKVSKSKKTRRKLEVTDSNEGPLEKLSNSRSRSNFCTDPDENLLTNSSEELVGKVME